MKHLKDNRGDANVSKMVIIAIVFVVGAILLVMITSAFRGPIGNWLETVVNDWFADENGDFTYTIDGFDPFGENSDNPLAGYTRRENGTYEGIQYIHYYNQGNYAILRIADDGTFLGRDLYYADGTYHGYSAFASTNMIVVSDDGLKVRYFNEIHVAQIPET